MWSSGDGGTQGSGVHQYQCLHSLGLWPSCTPTRSQARVLRVHPPGAPSPHQMVAIGNRQFFWPAVKGSDSWFRLMRLHPKCSNLNVEFNSFILPHQFYLGLCSHIDVSPTVGILRRQGSCDHIDDAWNMPANTPVETADQVEAVDTAVCCTLLAGCLCWFSSVFSGMLYHFSFVLNGKRRFYLWIFKMFRMKWGIQKSPQIVPPPALPSAFGCVKNPSLLFQRRPKMREGGVADISHQ